MKEMGGGETRERLPGDPAILRWIFLEHILFLSRIHNHELPNIMYANTDLCCLSVDSAPEEYNRWQREQKVLFMGMNWAKTELIWS